MLEIKKIALYLFLYIFSQLSFYLHFKDIMGQIQGRFLVWLPTPTDRVERVNLFFVQLTENRPTGNFIRC